MTQHDDVRYLTSLYGFQKVHTPPENHAENVYICTLFKEQNRQNDLVPLLKIMPKTYTFVHFYKIKSGQKVPYPSWKSYPNRVNLYTFSVHFVHFSVADLVGPQKLLDHFFPSPGQRQGQSGLWERSLKSRPETYWFCLRFHVPNLVTDPLGCRKSGKLAGYSLVCVFIVLQQ